MRSIFTIFLTTPGQANKLIALYKTETTAKLELERLRKANKSLSQNYILDEWSVND